MKKNQVLSLTLLALLTLASAMTASSAPSSQTTAPAGAGVALEDFLCNLSQTASPGLPGSTPAPQKTSDGCGTCGEDICDNKVLGTYCGFGRDSYGNFIYKYCIAPFVNTCADGRANCRCQSEYH